MHMHRGDDKHCVMDARNKRPQLLKNLIPMQGGECAAHIYAYLRIFCAYFGFLEHSAYLHILRIFCAYFGVGKIFCVYFHMVGKIFGGICEGWENFGENM